MNDASLHNQHGYRPAFTIVELLIVVVVIAVLAAVAIVSYGGISAQAKDSVIKGDISAIEKALELYYIDNGHFPNSGGSSSINPSWSTTNDGSWSTLEAQLVPKYISSLPSSDADCTNLSVTTGSRCYAYSYFVNKGSYCGAGDRQMYILLYSLHSGERIERSEGVCEVNGLNYLAAKSQTRIVKRYRD